MSVNLSGAELAEVSKCRRTVSVCTPSKRCKAGTLRLLPLKLTPIGSRPYRLQIAEKPWLVCLGGDRGRDKGKLRPSLRTEQAVFLHSALQLVVTLKKIDRPRRELVLRSTSPLW